MVKKILIIKLGALGDVIRTLPLAQAIKEKHTDAEITWVTKENALELFEGNPYIKEVFTINNPPKKSFDVLYNFDIEEEATSLAMATHAKEKYGFYSELGFPAAFNFEAEYYLNTLFDDALKKSNRKTYQEMMSEVAKLPYKNYHCPIFLTERNKCYARGFVKKNNIDTTSLIGVHLGASSRWPSKAWSKEKTKEFIIKAKDRGGGILLFGGPNEKQKHRRLIYELNNLGINILQNNPNNTLKQFASLVDICKVMICSDSLAMHVSLALKKPTIGLFFCTSPHEVEGYGLLTKIVSPTLEGFFPEKMDQYDEELVNSISAEEVLKKIMINEPVKVVNAIIKHPAEERFLIIKRKEGVHKEKWAFPGGIVEGGESIEQALKREIKEETGLEIYKTIKQISTYSYSRPNSQQTEGECYLVEAKGKLKPCNEYVDICWVTLEELSKLDHIEGLDEEAMRALYD